MGLLKILITIPSTLWLSGDGLPLPVALLVSLAGLVFDVTMIIVIGLVVFSVFSLASLARLHAQKKLLQKIFMHIPVTISFYDEHGRVRLVNREWEQIRGWSLKEVRKRKIDVISEAFPDPAERARARSFLAAATGQWAEFRAQVGDGRILDSAWAVIGLSDGTRISVGRDISERKATEQALRDAEKKYRDIFENAVEGIFQTRPNGGYLSVNPALARMLGFASPEELVKQRSNPTTRFYVDPARREEYLRLLTEHDVVRDFEYEDYRKDGSRIWLSDNAHAVRDSEGTLLYYEGTTQDITARKQAEQALRESEERYRELFENAKDAHYVHDLSGRYTSVNRAVEKLTGYSREEILGKQFTRFIPSEQLKRFRDIFCRKLREQGETSYEAELLTRDGRRVPIEVNSQLVLENGAPVGVQGTVRDITERKAAQEALVKLVAIAEQSSDAIVGKSLDGIVTSWNRGAELIFGYAAEEMVGHSIAVLLPPERAHELAQFLNKIERGQRIEQYETVRITKGGRRIHVSLSLAPVRDADGKIVGVSTIGRDITKRRDDQERLQATSRQLRALSARLHLAREEEGARIAREIHDELGSLLTSLKWDLERAKELLAGRLKPAVVVELQEKFMALEKLNALALQAIRRIASELRPSVLDDLGLMAAIEWQSQQFEARTGIVCNCDCLPEIPSLNATESTAVFRILQEALTNILRHAQATRVNIAIIEEAGELKLSIRDNGRGIAETEAMGQRSLGILGMRERAHLIGGELSISGVAGKETTVVVRVPLATGAGARPAAKAAFLVTSG